jgi:hypothetical protein
LSIIDDITYEEVTVIKDQKCWVCCGSGCVHWADRFGEHVEECPVCVGTGRMPKEEEAENDGNDQNGCE